MSTGIFWLAYSERERQQALDVTRALVQRESRDELGIGSIRDAIADLLFPGTSTLQTRARYFLFVPWSFQESLGASSPAELRRDVRRREERLIHALLANCAPNEPGLIGRQSKDELQRMPSSVYWQGLHVWGIRRLDGSQGVVERAMCRIRKGRVRDEDGEFVGGSTVIWNPQLPQVPGGYPEGADLDLTFDEADFLLQSLATEPATTGSMLDLLASDPGPHDAAAHAWLHPHLGQLPGDIRHAVEQGRRFSLVVRGAARLYNVVLAELDGRTELTEEHRDAFDAWAAEAIAPGSGLADWDLRDLWSVPLRERPVVPLGARIPDRTRRFVDRWLHLVQNGRTGALADDPDARGLIIERERWMKKGNSRTSNPRALKQWGGNSGTAPLDFRWGVARGLLLDIRRGLEQPRASD